MTARPSRLGIYVAVYLAFLFLPIALIPIFSVNDAIQPAFPLKGFTTAWYVSLAQNERLHAAVATTLIVGLTAASLATLAGITIAYADVSRATGIARPIAALARLPILIPSVILGIALLILVNLAGLGPSRAAVILGHTIVALPTTVVVMRGRFAGLSRSLEEAAMDLGATEWISFRRIALPLARPAIAASFLLAFLTSFDEFLVAFFLTGTDPTLPIFIWSQLRFPKELPGVMALGTIILAVSIALAATAEIIRRRGAMGATGTGTLPQP